MALYHWLCQHPYIGVASAAAILCLVLLLAIFFGVWWGGKLARRGKPHSTPPASPPVRVVVIKMYKHRTIERTHRVPRPKVDQSKQSPLVQVEQVKAIVHPPPSPTEQPSVDKGRIHNSIESFSLDIYSNAPARDRLLSQRPLRVSVCNFEDVSNRIYPLPRFCESQNGFYCITHDGALFPHPEAFNGYYTPSLLQGTFLLDVCFTLDGDKTLSAFVARLTPAMVKHIDGNLFELTDIGDIDLRG